MNDGRCSIHDARSTVLGWTNLLAQRGGTFIPGVPGVIGASAQNTSAGAVIVFDVGSGAYQFEVMDD